MPKKKRRIIQSDLETDVFFQFAYTTYSLSPRAMKGAAASRTWSSAVVLSMVGGIGTSLCPSRIAFMVRRSVLPLRVLGKEAVTITFFSAATGPTFSRTLATMVSTSFVHAVFRPLPHAVIHHPLVLCFDPCRPQDLLYHRGVHVV